MTVYSRKKALFIIAISTLLVSGSGGAALLFFHLQDYFHANNDRYQIRCLVQTGPKYAALNTLFLAELLNLATDRPTNIVTFDVREGERRLLASHAIHKAVIRKIKPQTLYIDYELRTPYCSLGERKNTYLDATGVLFPAYPFYSPKKIPALYVGDPSLKWGDVVAPHKLQIAHTLLAQLEGVEVLRIDLANAHASLGKREIVAVLRRKEGIHTLRLPQKEYAKQLAHYFSLYERVLSKEQGAVIIDLRLPGIAFLRNDDKKK